MKKEFAKDPWLPPFKIATEFVGIVSQKPAPNN
jgi:hypothetical protein